MPIHGLDSAWIVCYISSPTVVGFTLALPFGILILSNSVFYIVFTVKTKLLSSETASRQFTGVFTNKLIDRNVVVVRISVRIH